MRFMEAAELRLRLPDLWCAANENDAAAIRAAVNANPGRMRRIHDLAYLLRNDLELGGWLYQPAIGGDRPIDLVSQGEEGTAALEERLIAQFEAAAPREIFDLPGQPSDAEARGEMILRLLWERVNVGTGAGGPPHDPLHPGRRTIQNAEIRLAQAVAAYLSDLDSKLARRVAQRAMADPDPSVRATAARAAGWLSGFSDVYLALTALRGDPEMQVRIAAIEALSPRLEVPEVAGEIAEFLSDPEWRVREAAIRAFVNRRLWPGSAGLLVPAVFDPADPVRKIARAVVPEDEVVAWLSSLARKVSEGKPVDLSELAALARADQIEDDLKGRAFVERLEALRARGAAGLADLADTIRALSYWMGDLPPGLWRALAAEPAVLDLPEDLLASVLRKARSAAAWVLFRAVLSRPAPAGGLSLRTGIAEYAGKLGKDVPEILAGLEELARDEAIEREARRSAVWAFTKARPEPAALRSLEDIALWAQDEKVALTAIQAIETAFPTEDAIPVMRRISDAASTPAVRRRAVEYLTPQGKEGGTVVDLSTRRRRPPRPDKVDV